MTEVAWFDHKINPIKIELLSELGKNDDRIAISEMHFKLLAPYDILDSKLIKGKRERLLVLPSAEPYNSVIQNGSKGVLLQVIRAFTRGKAFSHKAGDKFIVGGRAFPVNG